MLRRMPSESPEPQASRDSVKPTRLQRSATAKQPTAACLSDTTSGFVARPLRRRKAFPQGYLRPGATPQSGSGGVQLDTLVRAAPEPIFGGSLPSLPRPSSCFPYWIAVFSLVNVYRGFSR